MSDKPITIEVPEELLLPIQSAQIDVRELLIEALRREINRLQSPDSADLEIEQILSQRLPADKLGNALQAVHAGERIFGLHAGTIWMSDDFDAELPDEFWLGTDE